MATDMGIIIIIMIIWESRSARVETVGSNLWAHGKHTDGMHASNDGMLVKSSGIH